MKTLLCTDVFLGYYVTETNENFIDTLAKILYPALIFGLKSTKESCLDCHWDHCVSL